MRMGKSLVGTGMGEDSELVWGDEIGTVIDAQTGEILEEYVDPSEGDLTYAPKEPPRESPGLMAMLPMIAVIGGGIIAAFFLLGKK